MITIAAFPYKVSPYTACFYKALEKRGVKVLEGDFSFRWLLRHARHVDYFHIHWPSFFYAYRKDHWKTIRSFCRFLFFVLLVRFSGSKLLWTAHNLYPHDKGGIHVLDKLARHIVTSFAHIIFVHGITAKQIVLKEFPKTKGKITVIDHGNWINYYPNSSTKPSSRKRIGIPTDKFLYLFIGICKEYKNIHYLVESFKKTSNNAMLLIAGQFQDIKYLQKINSMVKGEEKRIRIEARYIPDDDIQYYLNASNVVVLPYSEVLTSGAAMLAISFGRPVIAPRKGYLIDVIGSEYGILYDANDPNGLLDAMRDARKKSFDSNRILEHAARFDWAQIAEQVLGVIR